MTSRERDERRTGGWATPISGLTAFGLWWFLSGHPSAFTLILAATLLAYLCLGYCFLALSLPQLQDRPRAPQFSPIPESRVNPRRALTP